MQGRDTVHACRQSLRIKAQELPKRLWVGRQTRSSSDRPSAVHALADLANEAQANKLLEELDNQAILRRTRRTALRALSPVREHKEAVSGAGLFVPTASAVLSGRIRSFLVFRGA